MDDHPHLRIVPSSPWNDPRAYEASPSATDSGAAGGRCSSPASRQLTRHARGDAVPARAATPSEPSLLRVSGIAGITIAAFCIIYFAAQMLRAVVS
jgi:hypothetical protein